MRKMYYYTVYLSNTDEIVASGTTKECAEQMKKSINGFHSMVSKNTLGIQNKYSIVKERIILDKKGNIIENGDDL